MDVYCIHRKQDEERHNKLVKELDKVYLNVTFIEPELIDLSLKETRVFNRAMDSLRRTTIKIVEQAEKKNLDSIAIMEDDCVFNEKVMNMFLAKERPTKFDFIHLASSGTPQLALESPVNGCFYKIIKSLSCQFYIINKQAYKKYLGLLKNNLYPIDEITSYMHMTRSSSYLVQPEPVFHEPGNYSTLRSKKVKY